MNALDRALARHFILLGRLAALVALSLSLTFSPSRAASTLIDWSKDYVQTTDAPCGEMAFTHMHDHGTYMLWVRGMESGTCSFRAEGLTFLYPPNFGPTTTGGKTMFSFVRLGNEVVVTWTPGYQ